MFSEELVQLQFPVFDCSFTPCETHLLSSLFQSGFPLNSKLDSETARSSVQEQERKRRRMISNRESARRSRWRKKRHLEEVTNQVNRLRLENRELKNRLCWVSHKCDVARREKDRLQTEWLLLRERLSSLCQILVAMPCDSTNI